MEYKISAPGEGEIYASINLPASKSVSNRALILKALSKSSYKIENLSNSDDTKVLLDALSSKSHLFDVGAAGTSMRFLTAYLSGISGDWTLTGSKRMQQRPISALVDALNSLGAQIEYPGNPGFPPLKIKGRALNGGEVYLSGSISSQFISALLMVAPTMRNGLTLHLEGNTISTPYIKLTLLMMSDFGVKADWESNTIKIYPSAYKPVPYKVESDWSAASYWYSIAALSKDSRIELKGLNKDSGQGDSKTADLFIDLGIDTRYTEDGIVLTKNGRFTKKMFHNFINEPDLAQTFVVVCCMLDIPFLFTGLQSLKIKETDRIEALKTEMKKLGYIIKDSDNSILEWDGEKTEPDPSPVIQTYEDHRMAMAFAPAVLKLGSLNINDPGVVTKSYVSFWKDLEQVGFTIKEV